MEEDLRREQETLLRGLEMQEKDREVVEEKQQEAASTLKGLRRALKLVERCIKRCNTVCVYIYICVCVFVLTILFLYIYIFIFREIDIHVICI